MKPKVIIRAYHTHYKIIGYELGMFYKLEYDLSTKDPITFKQTHYYKYDKENKILYIPRGYNEKILEDWFKVPITYVSECNPITKVTFNVECEPRDNFQREVIRFLSGKEEYAPLFKSPQMVLNIPTRSGKTYCAVATSSILQCRTLVVTHRKTLRDQWADDIVKYTQLTKDNIFIIDGSKGLEKLLTMKKRELNRKYIFLVIHRTLQNAITEKGPDYLNDVFVKVGIGIKIIDEAHKEFTSTLALDYATDVWKTFYLTATFALSDPQRNAVFQKSFNRVVKLSKANPNSRKHVNVIFILFQTHPTPDDIDFIFTRRGFNAHNYISYELEHDELEHQILRFLNMATQKILEGRLLVASSTIASIEHFSNVLSNHFPKRTTCAYYEGNKDEHFREYDNICATVQMLGTGITMPGLQMLINTEPTRSTPNSEQLAGRMAEYAPDKDTYFVEFIDKSIPKMEEWYKRRRRTFSKLPTTKSINVIDTTIIR